VDLLFTLQWAGLEHLLVGYVVNDFSSLGIVEFKCPYTQHDSTPQEACTDPTFYCSLNNDGTMLLNQSHQYYYQVQLQLYVIASDWCDFCIFHDERGYG